MPNDANPPGRFPGPLPRDAGRRARAGRGRRAPGVTALELMLVVAIVGVFAAIALPAYEGYRERLRIAQAVTDIGAIGTLISKYGMDNRAYPESLTDVGADTMRDPWGRPYQYVNHEDRRSRGRWRRDKNIVPINTDFDVFSMGKDGDSRPPLTARMSRDDVVRANNGRFIGLASDYDP
ncbi:MAG: prepilin-type N-terminal cleavage/methylation domain-containing protein [Burkholderiales bacterium]|nr:prepilin-type N-terminal cleavage/methylation domain-containing protein [Burkholderiales bacterium]